MKESKKGRNLFVDINQVNDLEDIFHEILKIKPNKLLIILPEFKEREYWHQFDSIPGELLSLPHDADTFTINGQPSGLRIWDAWIGLFDSKQIISAVQMGAKSTNISGELWKLDVEEEILVDSGEIG